MNKIGEAYVRMPLGIVGPITLKEIVRQGTIFGPMLCGINTDKVNKIGNKCFTTIGPNIKCESLIFVDDIEQSSSQIETIEKAVSNCRSMELLRKFTFNNKPDKTSYMIITPNKRPVNEKVKTKLKWGEIQHVKEYKYLGEWYNEKGNNQTKINKKNEKINFLINQIKTYRSIYKVGDLAIEIRFKIYKTVIIPTLFHNVETWSNITKKEIKDLEQCQKIY